MTVADATMNRPVERSRLTPIRGMGLLSIATAVASFVLLAAHPGGEAKTFPDVLQNEAANRTMNAIVHGGFIAVLALQLVCYAALMRRLAPRLSAIAGMIFFAIGTGFLCASLLADGLVLPAIAARYALTPDKIDAARTIFVLLGTTVSFLMPIALMFQSAAVAVWGWTLTKIGSRLAGAFGLGLGGLSLVALVATANMMNAIVLMGAMAAMAVWAIIAGVVLIRAPD